MIDDYPIIKMQNYCNKCRTIDIREDEDYCDDCKIENQRENEQNES